MNDRHNSNLPPTAHTAHRHGLALVFTLGVTLTDWQAAGFLDREVDYYRRLSAQIGPVTFITCGGEADQALAETLDGITVLTNPDGLDSYAFMEQMPRLYAPHFQTAAIIKSNQIKGAQAALDLARLTGARGVVRCGYLLSRFIGNRDISLRMRLGLWRQELQLFRRADAVLLPTPDDIGYARRYYPFTGHRLHVVPNFVDTGLFSPQEAITPQPGLFGFVGRIAPQKNLPALIEALAGIPGSSLRIIGDGEEADSIRQLAAQSGVQLEITGRVQQRELPRLLAECELFILPSLYEGLPKALLEAMAQGLPVVATAVQGSERVIAHGENGWLCDAPTADSIRRGILALHTDPALRARMGRNARQFIIEHYSLESVLARELAVYRGLGIE